MKYPILRRIIPLLALVIAAVLLVQRDPVLQFFDISTAGETARLLNYFFLTVIWLMGAAIFNQLNRWLVWDKLVARAIGAPVPAVLKELSAVLVYMVTMTAIVGIVYEKSIMAFLAALGAGGLVLGLGLRSLVADIFTGLAINIDRSFIIGDWIQINEGTGGVTIGQINDIGWRCTCLTTESQTNVVVPNGVLGMERMVNISRPGLSTRYEVSLTVEFSVSPDRVKRVMFAALRALEHKSGFDTSAKPVILIEETSSLGVKYLARYWIFPWAPISPTTARDMVLDSLLKHLYTAGIALAYPKADIYTSSMPARQFDSHSYGDLHALLKNMDIFKPLDTADLDVIVEAMERRKVAAGKVLFHQGDAGDSLFVLIEGLLDVNVNTEGREKQIARILPGECLGEMSLLTGEHRSATIRAVTESVVYEISKQPISQIMKRRPALLESLSEILARRQINRHSENDTDKSADSHQEMDGFTRQFIVRMREFLGLRMSPEQAVARKND